MWRCPQAVRLVQPLSLLVAFGPALGRADAAMHCGSIEISGHGCENGYTQGGSVNQIYEYRGTTMDGRPDARWWHTPGGVR